MRVRVLVALGIVLATAGNARADDTFGVSIAMSEEGGKPVRDDAWMTEQIAAAKRLFAPFGVHFRRTSGKSIAPERAHVETRADRDAFAGELEPGAINVFVVASLRDVDEAERMRMGVCWRRAKDGTPYIILSSIARPTVLAHELGHFFGNPHSKTPDNVMSYERTGADVFFDVAQAAVIARTARRHVARKVIVPLSASQLLP